MTCKYTVHVLFISVSILTLNQDNVIDRMRAHLILHT